MLDLQGVGVVDEMEEHLRIKIVCLSICKQADTKGRGVHSGLDMI
jgi:hypothetical protein